LTRGTASNVAVSQDPAGNLKPAKDKSTERIDGIVALIMAIGRAMVAKEQVPATPMPP
jgi:phage terminase large subunit-like protein